MNYQHIHTQKVCRSANDKVLCGVCGGLADYWDVSSFWVRVAALVAFVMWFPLSILVYFVCCWMMPSADLVNMRMEYHAGKGARRGKKRFVRNSREAFVTVSELFNTMESRICKMEDVVTSKEYILNKKFENL